MSEVKVFWKHQVKRGNCLLQALSPFPSVFSNLMYNFPPISLNLKLLPANSLSLEESLKFVYGEGLKTLKMAFVNKFGKRGKCWSPMVPQCFPYLHRPIHYIRATFNLSSVMLWIWNCPKYFHLRKEVIISTWPVIQKKKKSFILFYV